MEFNTEIFGERLNEIRVKSGITTVKLGKAIGVTDSTISMWENGKIRPSVESLYRLAKFFNVPAGYLIGTEG